MHNTEEKEQLCQTSEDEVQLDNMHEPNSDLYCQACMQNLKDTNKNPESILCASCREHLIRYPYPKWLFAVVGAVLIICLVAFIRVPSLVRDYKMYRTAESAYKSREYNTAANEYLSISTSYSSSMRIHEKLFLTLVKAQRFGEASDVFDKHLANKKANGDTYNEIKDDVTLLDGYFTTYVKIQDAIKDDTNLKEPSKLYQKVETFTEDKTCDQSIVLYYLAQLNLSMKQYDQAVQQYKKAYAAQPMYTFIASEIGIAQRHMKQYDEAIKTYNEAFIKDSDDPAALRGIGVVYLLKGDYEKALEYTKKAYDLNPNGMYIAESYATALYANKKIDEAKELYNTLKSNKDYVVDQDYERFLNGEITLDKLYLD